MHKISLKDWVILLTIIPTTLIGLSIAGYFSYSRYIELDDFLTTRSQSIIEPLAIASVDPILHKQREKLRHLVGATHRSQSSIVKNITVFTQDNQILVTSAYNGDINLMRLDAGEAIPQSTSVIERDNFLIFRTPIIDESSQTTENDALHSTKRTTNHQNNIGYIAMQVNKDNIKFNQQSQILTALSIVFFGSLISALFSIRLIKNVTRPVSAMVKAIDRIREGKQDSRVSGQLIGELNFLKNGINAMAQSLGDYHDEMQGSIDQATIDLRESLEQFEIQNVELDIAKRKAQDANKVKSEFLANMSHELRTPLNGVIGFTRQVLKTPLSDTQRDYLQTIERSAANLLSIINDILDFSKLDAGKMVIESIPFSLRETAEEALTLLAPSAHQKNIELSLNISSILPDSLIGDAMRIKQILINLASNAIKFTDKGSVNIDIRCEHVDNHSAIIKVELVDTGIGMSPEQQSTIFEAFGQADKSVTRLYGGTGLGLVISQRLVSEMHGNMGFLSIDGQGSTFWFTFQCEVNPMSLLPLLNTHGLKQKHILYFEPHNHSRMSTTEIMISWDMKVSHATSLKQLSEILQQQDHLDYILIGHDASPTGINDFKKSLKAIKTYNTPIHVALNSSSPSIQETLIASGASSCISKPITPYRLCKALRSQGNTIIEETNNIPDKKIPVKVLAVDDNDANLKLIKALLLEQVDAVITATNGKEALALCKNEKYALIFMDIQMPVMDGVTALTAIKEQTFNDTTPIIAVTAHALSGEKDKLLEQGFDFYMTKPIDETMLRHTIYEYCDLNILTKSNAIIMHNSITETQVPAKTNVVIDWPLALKRAGNKAELAKDMLKGLAQSLPETKQNISEALTSQDTAQLKTLIHKLNGACCYSGVPNLGYVTHLIETELKRDVSIDDLEPEFLEFFEHLDSVIRQAPIILSSLVES
ncbi:MAG: two-component system sensor histidine kinase BarA [Alteromonadaceae bacterium]|jgi:two-component system sensor histidine kinase BarA